MNKTEKARFLSSTNLSNAFDFLSKRGAKIKADGMVIEFERRSRESAEAVLKESCFEVGRDYNWI